MPVNEMKYFNYFMHCAVDLIQLINSLYLHDYIKEVHPCSFEIYTKFGSINLKNYIYYVIIIRAALQFCSNVSVSKIYFN